MRKLVLATAALASLGIGTAAIGQSAQNPAVKARQGLMTNYAFNLGILGAMAKGDMEYNAEAASAAASNLAALSGTNQMMLWPEGTDNESMEGTKALPAIWEDGSDVGAKAEALHEAAMALADTAGDGVEAVQAGMAQVGQACGACHKAYRQSDN